MPLIMYYGSKISDNMTITPEGYLICRNVPIGRVGYMDYLGEELGLDEMRGQIIKVYRSPEELFSKATIASFEGKSVTNNHPTNNINLNTVGMLERGHIENVHQDGDFLIGDLYIKEAGLIAEVENGKREVSCGYDCQWIPIGNGKYEQKEIVGNHVAVVQNGRAGSRVAIKDSKPNKESGGNKMTKNKITKSILAAIGFKHFAQDADPADIAEAMDALNEDKGEDTEEKKEVKDSATIESLTKQVADMKAAMDTFFKDAKADEKCGADAEFEGLEKEVADADPEKDKSEVVEKKAADEEPDGDEEKKKVADSAIAKFVKDMKPIIMAIPDEKTRNEAAKQFAKSVRDSRAAGVNGYGNILNTVTKNKQSAMDTQMHKTMSQDAAVQKMCDNYNKKGAK